MSSVLRLDRRGEGFAIVSGDRELIVHGTDAPFVFVGRGDAVIEMNRGNFRIEDRLEARIPLTHARVAEADGGLRIAFSTSASAPSMLTVSVEFDGPWLVLRTDAWDPGLNRFWFRLPADPDEHVWGGGEQMSYFNLRGRRFPFWTSEPGVGRDKTTLTTFHADKAGAGGDYWTTNYPQPTYLSSRRLAVHLETLAYSAFDFRRPSFHEIEVWAAPTALRVLVGDDFRDLVTGVSDFFGRPPPYPDWALSGAVIGLKGGQAGLARLDAYVSAGAAVAALWCEDWVGVRQTSFGRRLFWDWRWDPARYPDLPKTISDLRRRGVRFLGYVNPYLCVDGSLYPQALALGHLALKPDADEPYIVDFGEFYCGVVDFTRPEAAAWFAEEIIGRRMIDVGLDGWMADFGEYLPHDVRLFSGMPGTLAHNAWPPLWAKVNHDGVASRERAGDVLYFMRAGYSGVQPWCPLLWAGDQSVDFSRHDGLQTVICGALSSGLLGNPYHHSDIGGYTSLFGNVRTRELLMRWAEMAAFTPMMRTHEGNRPDDNLQVDQDLDVLAHFARMTRIFRALSPYVRTLADEAQRCGLPLQRPLFLEFPDEVDLFDEQTAYLYGPDLLVAPVIEAGAAHRHLRLPRGAVWTHIWTGRRHEGGPATVDAPFGQPPVFYREGSSYAALFDSLASL